MTRALYESFVHVRTITKNAKRKTPGSETASYVCFACPHCKFEVEVPETCVQQRTARPRVTNAFLTMDVDSGLSLCCKYSNSNGTSWSNGTDWEV